MTKSLRDCSQVSPPTFAFLICYVTLAGCAQHSEEPEDSILRGLKVKNGNLVEALRYISTDIELDPEGNVTKGDLGRKWITDEGLAHLASLDHLEELDLRGGFRRNGLTDAGLAHIGVLVRLKKLHLDACDVTDAGLAHLKNLVNLETLSLTETSFRRGQFRLAITTSTTTGDVLPSVPQ